MAQMTVPSWQAQDQHCEHCGAKLKAESVVWLELRTSDNSWHIPGAVMEWTDPDSQGCFPFGPACAEYMLVGGDDPVEARQK